MDQIAHTTKDLCQELRARKATGLTQAELPPPARTSGSEPCPTAQ